MTDPSANSSDLEALLGDLSLAQRDKHVVAVLELQSRIDALKEKEEIARLSNAADRLDRESFSKICEQLKVIPDYSSPPWAEFLTAISETFTRRRSAIDYARGSPLEVETRRHAQALESANACDVACDDLNSLNEETGKESSMVSSIYARKICAAQSWNLACQLVEKFIQDLSRASNFSRLNEEHLLRASEYARLGVVLLEDEPGSKRMHDAFWNTDRRLYRSHLFDAIKTMCEGGHVHEEEFKALIDKVHAEDEARPPSRPRPR